MNFDPLTAAAPAAPPPASSPPAAPPQPPLPARRRRRFSPAATLLARGEPMIWLTGGGLAIALCMIVGLLLLVFVQGVITFWPVPVVQVETITEDAYLGEVTRHEYFTPEEDVFEALPEEVVQAVRAHVAADGGRTRRELLRTGNFDLTRQHFNWVEEFLVKETTHPPWALVVERSEWGRAYGIPKSFELGGSVHSDSPEFCWNMFQRYHGRVRELLRQRQSLERYGIGAIGKQLENARLEIEQARLDYGASSAEVAAAQSAYRDVQTATAARAARIAREIQQLNAEMGHFHIVLQTVDGSGGEELKLSLAEIVRAYPANQLSWAGKMQVYLSRWWEFLTAEPREANSEGGVFPAIFGTVAMTLLMSLAVVPFGVMAALYLREYASGGLMVSAVRIAINNLAGVPSMVFGVFGLGFFCYIVGAYVDGGPRNAGFIPWPAPLWFIGAFSLAGVGLAAFLCGLFNITARAAESSPFTRGLGWAAGALWFVAFVLLIVMLVKTPFFNGFFSANLRGGNPTYGTGGLLWASLTLALMTLPLVIVATEEALSAVPNSMREGSYACGASKWQTIRRIVLPRAMPGIMTGMILAMARGAGEVAPLMLVGAVKLAPDLVIDSVFPFIHPERSFMHLGFHIYDVGFQSPNSEAAKPMVFTTTLLLIAIVAVLNLFAVGLRSRLRRRFASSQF